MLALLSASALGEEDKVHLTVTYRDRQSPLVGATIDLYRVADVDEKGNVTFIQPFSVYHVRVDSLQDDLSAAAKTLEGYVQRDKLPADKSAQTNRSGNAAFSWDRSGMKPGLYLLLCGDYRQNGFVYRAQPVMFALPYLTDDGKWIYHVEAAIKHEKEPDTPEQEKVTRKALKRWNDGGHENERPHEVVVQLLCDGVVYDTQKLNKDNNWGYEWNDLDGSRDWSLTEVETGGYRITIEKNGVTFLVTNTYDQSLATPEPPKPERTPKPEHTPKPKRTPKPRPTMNPHVLPQTGQVWWPVPLLLSAGVLLIVLGLIRRRGDDDED